MHDIISLQVLIDGVTEALKNQIKKQEHGFIGALLATLAASVVQPVIPSVVKCLIVGGVMRTGRRYIEKKFSSDPFFKQFRDYKVFQLRA